MFLIENSTIHRHEPVQEVLKLFKLGKKNLERNPALWAVAGLSSAVALGGLSLSSAEDRPDARVGSTVRVLRDHRFPRVVGNVLQICLGLI